MIQQLSCPVSLLPPTRENDETIVDTSSVLVQYPNTQTTSIERIYSCLDCGEEFFYCEPLTCDGCGGVEFEESRD